MIENPANFDTVFKTEKDKLDFYERLFEMDVAYTIEKDMEEENDRNK